MMVTNSCITFYPFSCIFLCTFVGVNDKKGLRNLFVKMNILSPSPTPESKMPVLRGIQLISREDMLSSRLKISKEKLEKSNYIKKWLSTSLDDINGDDSQPLQRESRVLSFRNLNPIQVKTEIGTSFNVSGEMQATHLKNGVSNFRCLLALAACSSYVFQFSGTSHLAVVKIKYNRH